MDTRVGNRRSSGAWPSVCTMLGAAGSCSPQDKIFHAFDVDRNGRIDSAELGDLASRLGQRWTSQQTVAVMNEMDSDGGGTVDAAEFKAWFFGRHLQLASFRAYHTAYRHGCLRTDLRRLRALERFRAFDLDGDGVLDCRGLKAYLVDLGLWETEAAYYDAVWPDR